MYLLAWKLTANPVFSKQVQAKKFTKIVSVMDVEIMQNCFLCPSLDFFFNTKMSVLC